MDKEKLSRKEKKAMKKAVKQNKEKMNPADKKGVALICVLVAVTLAMVISFISMWGGTPGEDNDEVLGSTTTTSPVTTVPENENVTTTAPQQTTQADTTENMQGTQPTEAEKDEAQEILDVITNGINTLKASDASFVGHKEQVLDMELTQCSAPAFVGVVNKIMDMFIETEIYDFDFTDGKGMDPENKVETTTMDTFPPEGKPFSLTIDGVQQATKEQQGENTVYRVKLKPEMSTKDNPKTQYHENACDTLDLSTFNMPIGEITRADLEYPGAVVGVTLDKNGTVIGYYERLEIIGTGEAAAIGMTGGGTVEGYIDETWTIEWK